MPKQQITLVKFHEGAVHPADETALIQVQDNDGGFNILHFSPEAARHAGMALLSLAGQLDDIHEAGISGSKGERIRSEASPIDAFRVDWSDDQSKAHLHFWTKMRARFSLSLTNQQTRQLSRRLSQGLDVAGTQAPGPD